MRLTEIKKVTNKWSDEDIRNCFEEIHSIRRLTFNDDNSIDLNGEFNNNFRYQFDRLPFNIRKMDGDVVFTHSDNIKSLLGFPKIVTGECKLSFLKNIQSLEHFPEEVGMAVIISNCQLLSSLKGLPPVVHDELRLQNLVSLKSLDYLPEEIHGRLVIKYFDLENLKILRIFKCRGITEIETSNSRLNDILNKYYHNGRDVIGCQDELIEAGFEEIARLK